MEAVPVLYLIIFFEPPYLALTQSFKNGSGFIVTFSFYQFNFSLSTYGGSK